MVTAELAAAVPSARRLVVNPTPAARRGLVLVDVPADGDPAW